MSEAQEECVRSCCTCCCSWIVVIIIFFWVQFGFHFSKPKFSIEKFYVKGLNITSNDTLIDDGTIFFDLKLKNANVQLGVIYENIDITLYYAQNLSSPVAKVLIPGFYQAYEAEHNEVLLRNMMLMARGVPWEKARGEVLNGTTVFLVDLKTRVRYRYLLIWETKIASIKLISMKSKGHNVKIAGNLTVDNQGSLVMPHKKKDVRLSRSQGSLHAAPTLAITALMSFQFYWMI